MDFLSNEFHERIIKKLNNYSVLNETDLKYMKNWNIQTSQFHKNRLDMIMRKQYIFLNCMNNYINDNLHKLLQDWEIPNCGMTQYDPIVYNQINEINTQFNKWMKHKNTFHGNVDPKKKANRVYSFGTYFKTIATLLTTLGKPPKTPISMSPPWNFTSLELLGTLYGNNYPEENQTPFTTNLSKCLKLWAQNEGIVVNVQGKENLINIYLNDNQHNTVNLFLPSHRSPIPDAMVMGHFDLPHYILFANVASFFSDYKRMSETITSLPEVIGVGRIRGTENMTPYKKLIQSLKKKISPNVVIYPQGFVPSTGEILPITSAFVEKLLASLIFNGFRIKIIPVSYEVESEFLFDRKDHHDMVYTIKFGKPLEPGAVETLIGLQLGSIVDQNISLIDGLNKVDNTGNRVINKLLNNQIHGDGLKYFDDYLLTHWYEHITEYRELDIVNLINRVQKRFGFNLTPYLNTILENEHYMQNNIQS